MRILRFILTTAVLALLLCTGLVGAFAQDDANVCPAVVDQALDATNQLCIGTGRHKACYGHVLVDAVPQPGYASLEFDQPGDIVDISTLQSLILASFNADTGIWGVAQLRLQANLPTASSQDVTLLVFGDVKVENAVAAPTEIEVTVATGSYLPVYTEPSAESDVKQLLIPGRTAVVKERLEDGSWLRMEDPYTGIGWIQSEFVTSEDDLDSLNVVAPDTPFYRPMQAFYINTGTDSFGCAGVPSSGLLIQTPEGVAEVTLLINEVNISMLSTVYVNAQPGQNMTIGVLEGHATVNVGGATQTFTAGSQVTIPMSQDLSPSAPPSSPQPYSQETVSSLPITSLQRPITVQPPATPVMTSGGNGNPSSNSNAGGNANPPDNSNAGGNVNLPDNSNAGGNSNSNAGGGNPNAGSGNSNAGGSPPDNSNPNAGGGNPNN